MRKLKTKIKVINSLPKENSNDLPLSKLLKYLIFITILLIIIVIIYGKALPYLFSMDINKITRKKVNYTECNTKDYIIIGKDKTYSLSLTDDSCQTDYYEGSFYIKSNNIIFDNKMTGIIDNKYNITINDELFKDDTNE